MMDDFDFSTNEMWGYKRNVIKRKKVMGNHGKRRRSVKIVDAIHRIF